MTLWIVTSETRRFCQRTRHARISVTSPFAATRAAQAAFRILDTRRKLRQRTDDLKAVAAAIVRSQIIEVLGNKPAKSLSERDLNNVTLMLLRGMSAYAAADMITKGRRAVRPDSKPASPRAVDRKYHRDLATALRQCCDSRSKNGLTTILGRPISAFESTIKIEHR